LIPERNDAAKVGEEILGFDDFFRREYNAVMKVLMFSGASVEEAQDATQDAMLDLLRHWDQVHLPKAWVRTAALRNYVRSSRRARHLPEKLAAGGWGPANIEDPADDTVAQAEWVVELVRRLPRKQGQVLALSLDGLTSQQIAAILGDTPEAIRKNLQLARERLKAELARERLQVEFGQRENE
jgi:RNA polymerase sigma factor (sigma-70 family)